MELLVRGKYIVQDAAAKEQGIVTDSALLIVDQYITEIDSYEVLRNKYPQAKIVGNGRQLLLPGLIDSHSHGRGLTPLQKGVPNDYLENNLLDWAFMPSVDPELIAALGAIRHIRSGSTLVHNNAFDSAGPSAEKNAMSTIDSYLRCGIRLAYSPGVRNLDTFVLDTPGFLKTLPPALQSMGKKIAQVDSKGMEEAYFELFDRLYHKYNSTTTKILLSPSWAQGCTKEFLLRAKAAADALHKIPIHMHCLQTPIQKAFSLRQYGKTAIAYLDELGLIDTNTVLAHAIWVTEEDIAILGRKGASVTSHPSCNLAMRNGITPVYFMQQQGVNVALGMDDKTINDDEDIVMELRMMQKMHRVPSYQLETPALDAFTVLKMATSNASKVVGFGNEIGSLAVGKLADLILVDLDRIMNSPWMSPDIGIVDAFINRGLGTDVNTVVIGGRIVMEERVLTTVDEEGLYKEIRKVIAKGISSEQLQYAENLQLLKPYYQKWYNNWLTPEDQVFYKVNSRV